HRVAVLTEQDGQRQAQLKGDANPVPDPEPVVLDRPLARSVVVVPVAGYFVAAARAVPRSPGAGRRPGPRAHLAAPPGSRNQSAGEHRTRGVRWTRAAEPSPSSAALTRRPSRST